MMKRMIKAVLCALTVIFFSGCATVITRTDISGSKSKGLYPATRADVTGTYHYCRNELDLFGAWRGAGTQRHPSILEKAVWIVFATIDFPISLVTDTVCLPWDIAEKRRTKAAPTTDRTVPPSAGMSGGQ